jgi:large subunit ribosomal protein L7Ae
MHLGPLCDEKKIAYATVKSKTDLGRAAGIEVSTAAIAIVEAGEAKKIIDEISKKK